MGKKGNVREWQYSWEALCHVTTLRLYLFHPSVSPQDRCSEIRASLCPPHTLLIRWTEGHSLPVAVCVPVPAVVLDHSIPMQVKAMPDHIHVKFMLMFPVDHPLVGSFSSLLQTGDDPSQKEPEPGKKQSSFSLDNDTLMLASKGEIHFYCKNCSAKLTQEPLRSFLELPSVDWREVADNWFGACCCSFGGVSELLVANFEKFSSVSKGTCFVGSTSVAVHIGELAKDAIIECGSGIVSGNDGTSPPPDNLNKILPCGGKDCALVQSKNNIAGKEFEQLLNHNVMERNISSITTKASTGEKMEERDTNMNNYIGISTSLFKPANSKNGSSIAGCESETVADSKKCEVANSLALGSAIPSPGNSIDFALQPFEEQFIGLSKSEDSVGNGKDHCCTADAGCMRNSYDALNKYEIKSSLVWCNGKFSKKPILLDQQLSSSQSQVERKNTVSLYLGNGFMMGPSGVSKMVEWVPLHCSACSSLVGSYPNVNGKAISADESVQLFKCHISTSEVAGGPCDVFRKHTLQRVFINLLQASAENESSFRTVVRDLKTNVPMLQMVLLNANAWFCSGSCWERVLPGKEDAINTEELVEALAVEDGSRGFDGTNSIASGLSENYSCMYLKPVVKVLFCDCSSYAAEESRLIEDWALQKHAEDVYMLGEEIRALIDTLVSGKLRLPASCNSLQGFYLSFLEK